MEYFKKLSVQDITPSIIDSPVRVQEVAILQDSYDKDILGRIKFINQSKENIIAVFFDLTAKDISGEPVPLDNSIFTYQDMNVKPGEIYGNKTAIDLPNATRILSVEINKVVFEDGSIWKASDAKECAPLPLEQIDLPKENLERIEKELTKAISDIDYINYYYQENESAWLCSCGKINDINNTVCSFCECTKSSQSALLTKEHFASFCDNVNQTVKKEEEEERAEAARKKEEERKKAEEEKRKREEKEARQREERERELAEQEKIKKAQQEEKKKRQKKIATRALIVVLIVLVLELIVVGLWALNKYYLDPQKKYNEALSMMNDGEYQGAIDVFTEIEGYRDSEEQIQSAETAILDSKYAEAEELLEEGEYSASIEAFEGLDGYKDSEDKINEANEKYLNSYYESAVSLLNDGEYDRAIRIFRWLGEYSDSQTKVKEAKYAQASELLGNKEFDAAASEFKDLGEFSDAETKALEAQYAKAMDLMDRKEYDSAASAFESIGDYLDSNSKAEEAKYNNATELLNSKEYDKAISIFEEISDYGDSEEQILEAKYQKASELYDNEEYIDALDIFDQLGDYKDSSDKINNSELGASYNQAVDYISENKFSSAAWILSDITDYKDSKDLLESIPEMAESYILDQAEGQLLTKDNATDELATERVQKAYDTFQDMSEETYYIITDEKSNVEEMAQKLVETIDEYCFTSLIALHSLDNKSILSNSNYSKIQEGINVFRELAEQQWDAAERIKNIDDTSIENIGEIFSANTMEYFYNVRDWALTMT